MANKKLSKVYFGLQKTPIDDNTVFYASLDGTTIAEINTISADMSSVAFNAYNRFVTGLGGRSNVSSCVVVTCPIANIPKATSIFTVDFWIMPLNASKTTSAQKYLQIGWDSTYDTSVGLMADTLTALKPNHVRIVVTNGSKSSYYINGKLITVGGWSSLNPQGTGLFYLRIGADANNISSTTLGDFMIADLSVSNIDRGSYFPTLPQDFIDGYAQIRPVFNSQRQVYSDTLYSESKTIIAKIGTNPKELTVSRTSGNWASGDTVKVTCLGGEIVSGIVDTDTALARVVQDSSVAVGTASIDDVSKLTIGDTFKFYNPQLSWFSGDKTVTAIDTTNKTITWSGGNEYVYSYYLIFETTTSSSSPLVKANLIGTATAGASSSITLPSSFSSTGGAYTGYDIMIIGGTGIGQRRTINGYSGSGWLAAVSVAWTTIPDSTSVFVICNFPVTGTWSNLGTNEATFTLGTNTLLTTQDLQIDYSLNEVQGQGQTDLFTKTLGAEVNSKKLITGTVAIRDDFGIKIAGSSVECPHIMAQQRFSASLVLPTGSWETGGEVSQTVYSLMNSLNGVCFGSGTALTNGMIAQQKFSFNIIRMIEDKYGEIPAIDKIGWVKQYISKMSVYWYGYGTCPITAGVAPNGYRGVLYGWNTSTGWDVASSTNSSSPALVTLSYAATDRIDNNGFAHFLVYSSASDGVVASAVYTDYIYLDIELNTATGYDKLVPENPRRDSRFNIINSDLVSIANFYGKLSGDTTKIPHTSKVTASASLQAPSAFVTELYTTGYESISSYNNDSTAQSTSTNTYVAQHLFCFNLIRLIEDQYGVIPSADKATWLRNNIGNLTLNWWGYGSCPAGNKVYVIGYDITTSSWNVFNYMNTSSYPTLISCGASASTTMAKLIDANGFVNFLAYTDASNGTTASTIYTDYISLQVTLKDSALVQLPKLKSKLGNENIILVRKETKEVQLFFRPSEGDKVILYGEINKTSAMKVGTTLNGGYVVSNIKAFLTSLTTKLASGAVYNAKTKFDLLDDFSLIDATVNSSVTNGLNLFVNPSISGLVVNLLQSDMYGYHQYYKGIKTGKISVCTDKTLRLDDADGNIYTYVDISKVTNTTANYVPLLACIVKNTNGELQLLIAIAVNAYRGIMNLDNSNGRILLYPIPNRPLVK